MNLDLATIEFVAMCLPCLLHCRQILYLLTPYAISEAHSNWSFKIEEVSAVL